MRTRIKFCGLVRPVDVDLSVSLGVDFVGLVFYPKSPRVLDVETAAALRRRLPSYVAAVGLFVNEVPARVQQIAGAVGLDLLQFHGDETPVACAQTADRARLPWWRAVRVGGESGLLESLTGYAGAEAVLLDSDSSGFGGSGQGFDWSLVPPASPTPIVLSGGLRAGTVADGIARVAPMAVDVSSGIQGTDARMKDAVKMMQFVAAVLQADARRAEAELAANRREP